MRNNATVRHLVATFAVCIVFISCLSEATLIASVTERSTEWQIHTKTRFGPDFTASLTKTGSVGQTDISLGIGCTGGMPMANMVDRWGMDGSWRGVASSSPELRLYHRWLFR